MKINKLALGLSMITMLGCAAPAQIAHAESATRVIDKVTALEESKTQLVLCITPVDYYTKEVIGEDIYIDGLWLIDSRDNEHGYNVPPAPAGFEGDVFSKEGTRQGIIVNSTKGLFHTTFDCRHSADGWYQKDGLWYCISAGTRCSGFSCPGRNGVWYYFNEKTYEMETGWIQYNGLWYYLWSNGETATGWTKLGNNWYYFYPMNYWNGRNIGKGNYYGSMAYDTTIDGYTLGSDGKMVG